MATDPPAAFRQEVEALAARMAYNAGLGASEWEAFMSMAEEALSTPSRDDVAASSYRRPHCAWCGRRTNSQRFKSCREHYDLEQALRLYYNGGRHNGERV